MCPEPLRDTRAANWALFDLTSTSEAKDPVATRLQQHVLGLRHADRAVDRRLETLIHLLQGALLLLPKRLYASLVRLTHARLCLQRAALQRFELGGVEAVESRRLAARSRKLTLRRSEPV